MSTDLVQLDRADKLFYTRHFLSVDPKTGKRHFYQKRPIHAVREMEFGVRAGEIFGLLGPNGAGKTTTVKMICGLVRPSGGHVYVDGLHVEKKRLQVLRRVGVVLEGTRTCIWPLTPRENLAYFGNLKDVRGKVLRQRTDYLLDFIGLSEKRDVQVRQLSQGQKQKLAICIALIADPPVIVLDEPTTGLDVQSSRAIKDKVVEMTREQGKCAVVTTHDMNVAQELCDRIGIVKDGKLITCEPTEKLLDLFSEQVYEFRLDRHPDTQLLEAVPGVVSTALEDTDEGPMCLVKIDPEPELRSQAIYGTVQTLQRQQLRLRSIQQRQQNLESVFLKLTNGHPHPGARE
ncbi:MAG: ABC transporter ATP-binding protein [Candidatus Hydrogenedentota bacterium]